jgi:LuxR family transcriptional regulator, quorum-sensing system regulator CciR
MSTHHTAIVLEYIAALNAINDLEQLEHKFSDVVGQLGYDHFAMISHVDLGNVPRGFVNLINFPVEWRLFVLKNKLYIHDPVISYASRSAQPFCWEDIDLAKSVTESQYLTEAKDAGLKFGFTVPVHVPGSVSGSVNLASRQKISAELLPASHYAAIFSFEAARRITQQDMFRPRKTDKGLTSRQRECLALAGQGKSDSVIAQILGLKTRTVHDYIEQAKARYNASSRTTAVVQALFRGDISYPELLQH